MMLHSLNTPTERIDHHHNPVPLAGLSPPQKDEDLAGANGQVPRGKSKADTLIVADLDAERKVFATLQARYAIAGFSLVELADGSLLASRWNLCRPLPDAHAALQFLRKIGGAA